MPSKQMEMLYREMHRRMAAGDIDGASMIERMMRDMECRLDRMHRMDRGVISVCVLADCPEHAVEIRVDDIDSIERHRYDRRKSVVRLFDGTHVIARVRMDEMIWMVRSAERSAMAENMENSVAKCDGRRHINGMA